MRPLRNLFLGVLFGLGLVVSLGAQVVNGPYTVLPSLSVQTAGTAGTPSFSWTGTPGIGWYSINSTTIGESGSILPGTTATYSLGGASNQFLNGQFSGTVTSGVFSAGAGTALAPSYTFGLSTGTGFYLSSGGNIGSVGNILSGTDSIYNLGAQTANRFLNGYFGGTVVGAYLQVGAGAGNTGNIRLDSSQLAQWLTVELGDNSNWASLEATNLYASSVRIFPVTTGSTISQPTCAAGIEGELWVVRSGAGVATSLQACGADASGTFAWVTLL